jgi:hypothetical protein
MEASSHEKLRSLLSGARKELQKEADEHSAFLNQLELLQGSVDANEISNKLLESVLRAFPAKSKPMRAGAPAGDGLKDTRRLWEELNRIVKSRQREQS